MVQYLRPDSDVTSVTIGSWSSGLFRAYFPIGTPTSGWECIDETPAGLGDRITHQKGTAATYECTLSNPSGTPDSGTCTFKFEFGKGLDGSYPVSGGKVVVWSVYLSDDDFATTIPLTGYNGGVDEEIISEDGGSPRTNSYTFSTSEVSDWNNLKVRIETESHGGSNSERRNLVVGAIELSVPDPSATNRTGTLNQALPALDKTIDGDVAVKGALNKTLGALAYTITGASDRTGVLNYAFPVLAKTIEGDVPRTGSVNKALPALAATITGERASNTVLRVFWARFDVPGTPDQYRIGYVNRELAALGYTSAGKVYVQGATDNALPALTGTLSGAVQVKGSVSHTFASLAETLEGRVSTKGVTDYAFPAVGLITDGDVYLDGRLEQELPALASTITGGVELRGVVDQALPALVFTGRGNQTGAITGDVNQALPALVAASTGQVLVQGYTTAVIGALAGFSDGWTERLGTLDYALPALAAEITGDNPRTGTLEYAFGPVGLSAQGTAVEQVNASVIYTFPALGWNISGYSTAWRPVSPTSEIWTPVSPISEIWTAVER